MIWATEVPRFARVRDWSLATDPGYTRLRAATQAALTMAAAGTAEWAFVGFTHALQLSDPAGASGATLARIGFFDHATLVVAIVLALMIGMITGFAGPMVSGVRNGLVTFGWMPVPVITCLAAGLALGAYALPTLAGLVLVFAAGTYGRKFGPLGFIGGVLAFMGYFLGFFLRAHTGVSLGDLGWMSAELVLAVAVATAIQLTVFFPSRRAAARRALRSYLARGRRVAGAALELLDESDQHALTGRRARLHRRVNALGETGLLGDAHLAALTTAPHDWPAPPLARRCLAAHEAALARLAHLTDVMAERQWQQAPVASLRQLLHTIASDDATLLDQAAAAVRQAMGTVPAPSALAPFGTLDRTLSDAFTSAAAALADARRAWASQTPPVGAGQIPSAVNSCPVVLFGGWLPGSTLIARAASAQADTDHGRWSGRSLSPHTRSSIQMIIAGSGAIAAGYALSGYRFYWSALAAFFILVGTNHASEQIRKGVYRVAGTAAGVALSIPVANWAGLHVDLVIIVVLISLFLSLYLFRISYALMIVGFTVAVAELYAEFGELTDHLLMLRLEETAIGAAVTALVVLAVLPLHSARVARAAARQYQRALGEIAHASDNRAASALDVNATRQLDFAYQTLLATVGPRYAPYGRLTNTRGEVSEQLARAATSHHHARSPFRPAQAPAATADTAVVGERQTADS